MLVIALTGGIGSGKTAVADQFAALGVPVIDTDQVARDLVQVGSPALDQIRKQFGAGVFLASGELDRDRLRKRVFSEPEKRRQLEAILHPMIRKEVQQRIQGLEADYCIVVIPLLAETGQAGDYDRILVVDCPESLQIERVMRRSALSEAEVRDIMKAQASRDQRLQLADDVIENTGSLEQLQDKVLRLHRKYRELSAC